MPLFTFDCEDCDESFEQLVGFNQDLDEIRCPDCGGDHVHKQMSRIARAFRPSSSPVPVSASSCAPGGT